MPLSAGQYNETVHDDRDQPADRRAGEPRRRRQRRGDRAELAAAARHRSARATTSSRSAWTSGTGFGCSCTPGPAGSATSWPPGTSRSRAGVVRAGLDPAARPGPGLPGRGDERVLGLPAGPALGAALRAAQPRGDDGAGGGVPGRLHGPGRPGGGDDPVSPQLHRADERRPDAALEVAPEGPDAGHVWLSRKGAIDASQASPG